MSGNRVNPKTRARGSSFVWPAWRDRAERTAPTRARAVLVYIALGEHARDHPVTRGRPTRREQRRKDQAHRYQQPDYTERLAQELNALMRQAIHDAPEGDGLITGPLTVAARYASRHIVAEFSLDAGEHEKALEVWLVGLLGETIHTADLADYSEWRDESLRRVAPVRRLTGYREMSN
jgi:hypothetical protein